MGHKEENFVEVKAHEESLVKEHDAREKDEEKKKRRVGEKRKKEDEEGKDTNRKKVFNIDFE